MSETIAEVARREAEEAEREQFERMAPDAEPEPEAEPEPDDDDADRAAPNLPPEPPSDAAAERALKEIDRASETYVKKVMSVQGRTPLGLIECPLCPIPGFVPDQPMGEPPPEQRLAVMSVLGEGLPVEQVQNPHLSTCEACGGLGMVATGSRRPGYTEVMCDACQGNGYVDERHRQAARDVIPPPPPLSPPDVYSLPAPVLASAMPGQVSQGGYTFAPTPGGSADPYGRMPGHPLWGQPVEAGGT